MRGLKALAFSPFWRRAVWQMNEGVQLHECARCLCRGRGEKFWGEQEGTADNGGGGERRRRTRVLFRNQQARAPHARQLLLLLRRMYTRAAQTDTNLNQKARGAPWRARQNPTHPAKKRPGREKACKIDVAQRYARAHLCVCVCVCMLRSLVCARCRRATRREKAREGDGEGGRGGERRGSSRCVFEKKEAAGSTK